MYLCVSPNPVSVIRSGWLEGNHLLPSILSSLWLKLSANGCPYPSSSRQSEWTLPDRQWKAIMDGVAPRTQTAPKNKHHHHHHHHQKNHRNSAKNITTTTKNLKWKKFPKKLEKNSPKGFGPLGSGTDLN